MIERVIYIADDGTEFEDEDECRAYETEQGILPLFKTVQMWDDCEKPIPAPTCWTEIESALEKLHFIRGANLEELWDAIYATDLEHNMLDYGSFRDEVYCANDTDLLMYDGDRDCWVNVNRVFDECRKILRNFN